MTAFAVVCENVVAGYRGVTVLDGVTVAVAEGAMMALLGPNGAGKSTLLRVLTGLQPHSAGTVRLFGRDLRQIRPAERARAVAVVPQEWTTPMAFSVGELVALGRTVSRGRWARLDDADHRAIERALAYTDTLELRERLVTELSGGEKQRAVIAMALAQEPRLLLLDEPTAHLDINHRLEILQLIERLNREQGVAVLMTSHDLNLAAEFFPQLALLDHGRVAAAGHAAAVLQEDLLEEVYHCKLSVRRDETGTLMVLPARGPAHAVTAPRGTVHVICGGGSGAEILRRLCLGGWRVTCGALNEGDTDARTAAALGVETAMERPFSPVGSVALARAAALAEQADAVVVCEVPFGPGNVSNLDVAAQAQARGQRVLVNVRNVADRDYTPQQQAQAALAALVGAGAMPWEHVGELFVALENVRVAALKGSHLK